MIRFASFRFDFLIAVFLLSQSIFLPYGTSASLPSSKIVLDDNSNAVKLDLTFLPTKLDYFKMVPPAYPEFARQKGWQGTVVLKALVEEDGTCSRVEVEQSSGHGVLDRSAVQAVKQWEFSPARFGNNPYAVLTRVPVRFILTDKD